MYCVRTEIFRTDLLSESYGIKNGKDVREEVIKDLVKIHSVFIEKVID